MRSSNGNLDGNVSITIDLISLAQSRSVDGIILSAPISFAL